MSSAVELLRIVGRVNADGEAYEADLFFYEHGVAHAVVDTPEGGQIQRDVHLSEQAREGIDAALRHACERVPVVAGESDHWKC